MASNNITQPSLYKNEGEEGGSTAQNTYVALFHPCCSRLALLLSQPVCSCSQWAMLMPRYAPVETWLMEIQKRGLRPINAASHPLESHLRPSLPDVPYYLMSMAAIQNIADDLQSAVARQRYRKQLWCRWALLDYFSWTRQRAVYQESKPNKSVFGEQPFRDW